MKNPKFQSSNGKKNPKSEGEKAIARLVAAAVDALKLTHV